MDCGRENGQMKLTVTEKTVKSHFMSQKGETSQDKRKKWYANQICLIQTSSKTTLMKKQEQEAIGNPRGKFLKLL